MGTFVCSTGIYDFVILEFLPLKERLQRRSSKSVRFNSLPSNIPEFRIVVNNNAQGRMITESYDNQAFA
jgi:hypothetical protein